MVSDRLRFTWLFPRWALLLLLAPSLAFDVRAAEDADAIPKLEEVHLETKDGLRLRAVYYPSRGLTSSDGRPVPKKDRVPIILLHGYEGDCHDFDDLALLFQRLGHAVIVPDLRGHGESREIDRDGRAEKIESATLRSRDFADMVQYDLEAVKSYLITKNNDGELNIDKLCVVGVDMGAIIAADWAKLDWSLPVLSSGKQGQNVKALVLISPEPNFKGMKLITSPEIRSDLSILLIAGRENSHYSEEVNKLYKQFSKYHVLETSPKLEKLLPETKLQGAELLSDKSLGVEVAITEFVALLVKRSYPWNERRGEQAADRPG
jgi:pimeloyl-ACP methyl ester carboxylesterase